MTGTMRRGKYTLEFKEESVRQVLSGGSIASVAASLGIPKASLSNWVRQQRRGQLGGGDNAVSSAPVSAEQMEIARLRAEVTQLRMERDIAKKAAVHQAIQATLARRKTGIPQDIPVGLTETFANDQGKQVQWQGFLNKNQLEALSLEQVVFELRRFLMPPLTALAQ